MVLPKIEPRRSEENICPPVIDGYNDGCGNLTNVFIQSHVPMKCQKCRLAEFGQQRQVAESVHGQAEPLQAGFRTAATVIKVTDAFANAVRLRRKKDIFQRLSPDITDGAVDQGTEVQIAGAAHKEIVESATARFFHNAGVKIVHQSLAVITPACGFMLEKTNHLGSVFSAEGQIFGQIRVQISSTGDDAR